MKTLTKSEKAHQENEEAPDPSTPSEHHDAHDDTEAERTIRKSTRTAVVVKQAEREAIRAALQATTKVWCLHYNAICHDNINYDFLHGMLFYFLDLQHNPLILVYLCCFFLISENITWTLKLEFVFIFYHNSVVSLSSYYASDSSAYKKKKGR